jgi:type IV fimbrial biogenesis protein FimT
MDSSCLSPARAPNPCPKRGPTRRLPLSAGRRKEGFTLIEMMTTVSVLVVLLVIGAVSFNSTFKSNRLYSVQGEIAASLALARSESALRGVPVLLMASASTSGNEFGGGWTVFADLNSNDAFDSGEPVLRTQEAVPGDVVAKTGTVSSITFSPNGFLVPPTAVVVNICRASVTGDVVPEYQLTVQPNGMTDVSTFTCP